MPDVSADCLNDAEGVPARNEVLGRAISLQRAFDIGLEIGHERLRFDADKNAAGARLGNGRVNERELAAQAVEFPGLHGFWPALGSRARLSGFEIFDDQAVRMACGQVPSASHGAGSVDDFAPVSLEPRGKFVERVEIENGPDLPRRVQLVRVSGKQKKLHDLRGLDSGFGNLHAPFARDALKPLVEPDHLFQMILVRVDPEGLLLDAHFAVSSVDRLIRILPFLRRTLHNDLDMISIRSSETPSPDPLSDVLSLLQVQSFLSRRLEASGAWALRFPEYRHMKFGGIIEGSRWVWIEGVTEPLRLEAGDFYLLSHGGPYCFASDVKAKPVDGLAFMAEHLESDGVVRLRGGEGRTVGVGGRFTFEDEMSGLLLTSLPPLIHIRGDLPEARALRSALDLITFETESARPGGAAIGAGLCSVVLVNILRAYLAGDQRPRGWLGALSDRHVGAAIRLMHGDVAKRWKVIDLASEVGMSRTSFAERFKSLVGMAPLEYLVRWRMALARNALTRDDANLVTIAEAVGYKSDTAFSLAFKRTFGSSPGRYRSQVQRRSMAACIEFSPCRIILRAAGLTCANHVADSLRSR